LHLLGLIRATQSNFKEATDLLSKAALIDPQDAFIQYNLAKALVDSGDIKGSIPHHKMTVELSPHNPDAWLNYGKTVSNLKQHEEAISYYDKAISLNPNYAEAWSNKGISLRELKRYEEAITHYEKALSLKPNNPEAWGNNWVDRAAVAGSKGVCLTVSTIQSKVVQSKVVPKINIPVSILGQTDLRSWFT
jgi:tetratricopeptide (TPR) repeat protein